MNNFECTRSLPLCSIYNQWKPLTLSKEPRLGFRGWAEELRVSARFSGDYNGRRNNSRYYNIFTWHINRRTSGRTLRLVDVFILYCTHCFLDLSCAPNCRDLNWSDDDFFRYLYLCWYIQKLTFIGRKR